MNANYPRLNPGLLLQAFGQELRLFADPETQRHFDAADRRLDALSQQLRASGVRPHERVTERPDFMAAVEGYIEAMRRLVPEGGRIVLIVDTCEELAKLREEGVRRDAHITETSRIFRALHDGAHTLREDDDGTLRPRRGTGLPHLRVIFSGRRPLARAGAGWVCPSSALPPCRFLRLHEILGFEESEATQFLHRLTAPKTLHKPILAGSITDVESAYGFTYPAASSRASAAPARPHTAGARYNPFELQFRANWAKAVPPPTPAELSSKSDTTYIKQRVIARLHDDAPLLQLVPAVAALRHFDKQALRAAAPHLPNFDTVLGRLGDQEWIGLRATTRGSSALPQYDIAPDMADRLLRYVHAEQPAALAHAQALAAPLLTQRLRDVDLDTLDWTNLDAALRTVATSSQEALLAARTWWQDFEMRLLSHPNTDHARNWLSNVLGSQGAAASDEDRPGLPTHPLRPRLQMTHALAKIRSNEPPGPLTQVIEAAYNDAEL